MTAVSKDLYIEQGATFVLSFAWHAQGPVVDGVVTPGDPRDLTGFSARMQIRKSQGDTALVTATTANSKIALGVPLGGGAADPENGRITVTLSAADTNALTQKTAKYDLEVEDGDGVVYRLLEGTVTVSPNITQDPGDPPVGG